MRIGTMIGDVAERIPLLEKAVRRVRIRCRKKKIHCPTVNAATQRDAYRMWVREHDTPTAGELKRLRESIQEFRKTPLISVVMPVFNTPPQVLEEAIRSVREQVYDRWELCIADDCSTLPHVQTILARHATADPRIKVRFCTAGGNISATSNAALEMATGEFVALLDHDDLLPPHALYWVVEAINRHPDAALLYSDEDKIDGDGRRYHPYFKCDFNHELLLSQNMISHLGVYRRDLITELGGFRSEYDGAQDHDLALRVVASVPATRIVHIPRILYHWRAIPGSVAVSIDEKPAAFNAGQWAVAAHLKRIGRCGMVEPAPGAPGFHRVRYSLPAPRPLVSIVICTRDHGHLIRTAVDSITSRSTYENFEIMIVDNGSRDAEAIATLAELADRSRTTVVRDDSPFNYSRLNNAAVARTRGEIVCLLNDDIEVVSPGWLEEMVSLAILPDVAAVGARLWYPDGTLQHGGVIIGIGGVANHAHPRLPKGHAGYAGRAVLQQELSAVTGACLMVRRTVYDEVGGLDERLAVAFNDVDLCLRFRSAGYRNIWTPYAELIHHESASRGAEDNPVKRARFEGEVQFMKERWATVLQRDPFYSPHLSKYAADFKLPLVTEGTSRQGAA